MRTRLPTLFCMVMVILLFQTATPVGAATQATAQATDRSYVGADTCIECHEDYYDSYMKNRHSVAADPRTPEAQMGCESCHGPGSEHVDADGEGGIRSLKADSADGATINNAACLQCHAKGGQALWHGSEHEGRDLSCTSCHSTHNNYANNLAYQSQEETCRQCHLDIRAQLLRQSHHPIREGKMTCSDCHNAHGTLADKLVDAQSANSKCFECHADLRGPFLWDHPPVVEDCLSCHTPHGSSHNALLNAKMPYLCQRCHSNAAHPSELGARSSADAGQSVYRVLNNRVFYRACLNCHVAIHGSNHPSGKSLAR